MISTIEDLAEIGLTNGAAYAIKMLKKESDSNPGAFPFSENDLNQLGYRFLYELNRIDDAIEIFKFYIEIYPQSANACDSLGEAYFLNGNLDLAAIHYKKSLQLNPENKNASLMLRQIYAQH